MLWYKGWLETRWKFLFILGFYTAAFIVGANSPPAASPGSHVPPQVMALAGSSTIAVMFACVMLAGAGIATQPSFVVTKRPARLDVFYSLPAGDPVSFAHAESQPRMVGNGRSNCKRLWHVAHPSTHASRNYATRHAPVRGHSDCLWIGFLLRQRSVRNFSRRGLAHVGLHAGRWRAIAALQ